MKYIFLSLLSVFLFVSSPLVLAAETAVAEMATIMMRLNHYPTAEEKQYLEKVLTDPNATSGEKTMAGALKRMQHAVGGEDAKQLKELIDDQKATQAERELASILVGISHYPSQNDKKRLEALTK